MENIKLEDKEICSKCKGMCCKKSGCDYSTSDFNDLSLKALDEILKSGNVSIVSALDIKMSKNGNKYLVPFLYLRARNKNREVVDLLSLKTCCSVLTEKGCPYPLDKRPSGGVNLVPSKTECYPLKSPLEIVKGWETYQNALSKMVKRLTGKSVDKKLREDTENLIYDIMMQHFDYVTERERKEILPLVKQLAEIYPLECKKGILRAEKEQTVLKLKK